MAKAEVVPAATAADSSTNLPAETTDEAEIIKEVQAERHSEGRVTRFSYFVTRFCTNSTRSGEKITISGHSF